MATRKAGQGSKWIRPTTRLAIYLRDGMACAYCGHAVEEGERLSLDHIRPASRGGQNDVGNLVTCCGHCNSARGMTYIICTPMPAAALAMTLRDEYPGAAVEPFGACADEEALNRYQLEYCLLSADGTSVEQIRDTIGDSLVWEEGDAAAMVAEIGFPPG